MSELSVRSSCPTRSLSERRFRPYNITVMTSVVNSVASTANATNLPRIVSRRSVRSDRVVFSQIFTAATFTFRTPVSIVAALQQVSQRLVGHGAGLPRPRPPRPPGVPPPRPPPPPPRPPPSIFLPPNSVSLPGHRSKTLWAHLRLLQPSGQQH